MVRYAHFQLMAAVEAGIATVAVAPVVLGVRGLPHAEGDDWVLLLYLVGMSAFSGLMAGMTGMRWLGGEKGSYDSAVPVADPKTVLPTRRQSLRRSFDGGFVVMSGLSCLFMGLIWSSWGILFACVFFAPERVGKGVSVLLWERRHGLLLWRGRLDEQPLEKWRSLYSSPRAAVPG
ncbi:hypothetical protein ACFVU0_15360 [Streptomyces sp. NPDC058122]|uniref:hypothetical protein n=1 Tax=Streptomyces sp. NPDC058122 TaxID=3346349 RepID=UPI0036E707F4